MKIVWVCLVGMLAAPALYGEHQERNESGWRLEARSGVFIPTKKNIRNEYGTGLPLIQVEGAYLFCNHWDLWANVGWSGNKGRTPGFCYHSFANLVPVGVGLNYDFHATCNLDVYIGAGITGSAIIINDFDGFLKTKVHSGFVGGTSKTGLRYTARCGFIFDIFVDYYYTKFSNLKTCDNLQRHYKNWSGTNIGLGFGYAF
jgi:hypothetical protein